MPTITGDLRKMKSELNSPVSYLLPVGEDHISLNEFIGKQITLSFNGKIHCVSCGSKTKKSFGQGYCYKCFESSPETEPCILKPELCMAHMGIARDIEWAKANHVQPHIVYLSVTAGIKVGVTRAAQIPTRWIDQGATMAIKLADVPNRHIAGVIEVFLKAYYSDKTSWQKMLKDEVAEFDLLEEKQKASNLLPEELKQYIATDNTITTISYPQNASPDKITSATFDKTEEVSGVLTGIKGQYLILDNKNVINIRRHAGYEVNVTVD